MRRQADDALAKEILAEGITAFVERWEAQPLFASRRTLEEDVLRRQRALQLRNDPGSLAASLAGIGTGALPSLWDELERIETPTLLIVGALDPKFVAVAERMAADLPRAELVIVPNAGHRVHLERPGAWLEAVTAFLR
jgi:pimeloyl-ACP methyl ester carboxylesterase